MKDAQNNIDDLFRESLNDFSPAPPEGLWKQIESALPPSPPALPGASSGISGKTWWGTGFLLVAGLVSILWFFNKPDHTEVNTMADMPVTSSDATISAAKFDDQQITAKGDIKIQTPSVNTTVNTQTSVENPVSKPRPSVKAINLSTNSVRKSELITPASSIAVKAESFKSLQPEITLVSTADDNSSFDLRSDFYMWLSAHTSAIITPSQTTTFELNYKNSQKPFQLRKKSIPLVGGINAGWDMIFYNSGHKKQSQSLGVSISTLRGPWEFETGLNYMISDDNGRYLINFSSYDSVGFYNKVVSFSPDLQNPGRVIYNTVVEGVYDSVAHNRNATTSNQYTYLQIPLMAGYRVYTDRILTVSLKAGPVFSLMTGSREESVTFSQEGTSLIGIDNQSPSRVSSNWQIAAGLGIGVRLSPRFTFLAEPVYRSYLRPVYLNSGTKPYSLGIRTGLLYRF